MVRDTRRWLVPVALAVLLVLAGCSGGGGDAAQPTAGDSAVAKDAAKQTAAGDAAARSPGPNAESQSLQVEQRALIRTGTVSIRVGDYDATRRNLSRETRRLGGFVGDTSERVHTRENRSWTSGKLVFRVPKGNFSTLVSIAKRAGEVQTASTNTEDVTKQLVDIQARLNNLKAQRQKLRGLYEEANDTETVLEIQQRLSEVQSEIEQLQAERKSLQRRVAYSTLTVHIDERRPDVTTTRTDPDAWYDTGLVAAFLSSANGVVVVVRGAAVGLAYALPYVVAFGVPLGGAVALWRRRSEDATAANLPDAPESTGGSESGDEDD